MEDKQKPGLFSVISLSAGTMLGSGWLFASYYASKESGPASVISWIVGAIIILIMALLLSELAVKFKTNGLFTQILSISHNQSIGFVTSISNWLLGLIAIPSEAIASSQYIASIFPKYTKYLIVDGYLTFYGFLLTSVFLFIYFIVNYWGIKTLAKINNSITILKFFIPVFVSILLLTTSFNIGNFTSYENSFIPYGVNSIFVTIVSCGIFYSFFGFQIAASFAVEMKNPRKNLPIALISSVLIVLVIYLLLQISFIGAIPSNMIENGWHTLNFQSPLAQLLTILGFGFITMVLYADATISPSGTAIVYLGGSSRMLNEMAKAKQMPRYFAYINPKVMFSRRSLFVTSIGGLVLIFFFRNWQLIATLTTTFIIVSSLALPVAYTKLKTELKGELKSYLPFPKLFAYILFLFLCFLLLECGLSNILIAFILYISLMIIYSFGSTERTLIKSFKSSWTIFLTIGFILFSSFIRDTYLDLYTFFIMYIFFNSVCYYLLIHQKNYK